MSEKAILYSDVASCVDATLQRIGRRIHLGTPLGLGKANHLVNEFYRRACEDPRIELRISTALTLAKPRWKNELERRFLEPLTSRLFAGYPELAYVDPLRAGTLPENIRVSEFYFQPGSALGIPLAQQQHTSSNYSHVVRDLIDAGMNVLAQLIGKEEDGRSVRYSLSCNPDLTLDLVPRLRESEKRGHKVALLAQVNRHLPFMYGDAAVDDRYFDAVVDGPRYDFPLFAPPNYPVETTDYMIGLHVSALIRDGGTLQIGIGALGDAISFILKLRHQRNPEYLAVLRDTGILDRFEPVIQRVGGTTSFAEGLFAGTEMLVAGFLELYRCGILNRRVYGHAGIQRLLNTRRIDETVTPAMLRTLVDAAVVSSPLSEDDVRFLKRLGVLRQDVVYEDGRLRLEGEHLSADLTEESDRSIARVLGARLAGGHVAHSCFFLGPQSFYDALNAMDRSEREQICMTRISAVNELYGDEELKRLQRKAARFVNTGLVATLSGAVASDALEDGRVVSGVGGQYNFVAMAHALEDGRSILMIRSTRKDRGRLQSNIRWSHSNITIPRHLRDFIVTEYGIADLRGRTDEEVAIAMLQIADSRFQEDLLTQARRAGKISASYQIPAECRSNNPERLEKFLAPFRARELFQPFPFGSDLTAEEAVLMKALSRLKEQVAGRQILRPRLEHLRKASAIPDTARPYLERMGLDAPRTVRQILLRRVVAYALASVDAI